MGADMSVIGYNGYCIPHTLYFMPPIYRLYGILRPVFLQTPRVFAAKRVKRRVTNWVLSGRSLPTKWLKALSK